MKRIERKGIQVREFSGLDYIKLDIANQYGLDKEDWDVRLDWVETHIKDLHKVENVDCPVRYRKAVRAMEDTLRGKPTGHLIEMDATASGIAIMGCLDGCESTLRNTNLINTGHREDIYRKMGLTMSEILHYEISRSDIKYPVMTRYYGSTAKPKELFGVGDALYAFYETLNKETPGAEKVMLAIQSCWNPAALSHSWTLPDGHVAHVQVLDKINENLTIHNLEDKPVFSYTAEVNIPMQTSKSLAANVTQSIDGWIVREMNAGAVYNNYSLLSVHDAFLTHPNYMNLSRRSYLDIMMSLARSNLLENILNEITGSQGKYTKTDPYIANKMNTADYFLS